MKPYKAREQIEIDGEWVTFSESEFIGTTGEVVDGSMFVDGSGKRGLIKYKGEIREMKGCLDK